MLVLVLVLVLCSCCCSQVGDAENKSVAESGSNARFLFHAKHRSCNPEGDREEALRVASRESRKGSESIVEGRLGLSSLCVHLGCRWLRHVEHRFLEDVLRVRKDSLGASRGS